MATPSRQRSDCDDAPSTPRLRRLFCSTHPSPARLRGWIQVPGHQVRSAIPLTRRLFYRRATGEPGRHGRGFCSPARCLAGQHVWSLPWSGNGLLPRAAGKASSGGFARMTGCVSEAADDAPGSVACGMATRGPSAPPSVPDADRGRVQCVRPSVRPRSSPLTHQAHNLASKGESAASERAALAWRDLRTAEGG